MRRPERSQRGDDRLVVLRGVDVERDRARDRHLADVAGALVEQAPDALVAVEAGEVGEHRAGERDRVPRPSS